MSSLAEELEKAIKLIVDKKKPKVTYGTKVGSVKPANVHKIEDMNE